MAKEEKVYKVAPRVALTSKGGIIDDGTVVTAEHFANAEIFNSLVKAGKIMTVEDYNKRWEDLNKPQEDAETIAKKAHDEAMQKAIDDAVAKATKKATEEARKQFEAEYAKKAAEEAEKKAKEEAEKAAQNGDNSGNQQ